MMYKKETIYFILVIIASITGLFKTGLIAYILTPDNFGYFTLFLIISGYFQYSQLGVLNGLGRELPIEYGKGNIGHALTLVGSTIKSLLLTQFIFLLICLTIISFITIEDREIYITIIAALVSSIVSNFYSLSILRLRCELRLIEYAVVNFSVAVFGLILTIFLASKIDHLGAFLGIISAVLFGFLYTNMFILDKPKFNPKEEFNNIKKLLLIGTPMILAGLVQTTLLSLDKIILVNIYSIKELGIYGFASITLTMGIALNGILSTYFIPKILHQYGVNNDLFESYKASRNISLVVLIVGLVLFPLYYFIISFGLESFFQEYLEAKYIMTVFYIPALFCACNLFGPFLMAAEKFNFFLVYELILLALVAIIYTLIVRNNLEIIYFSYTLAIVFVCGYSYLFYYSRRHAYNMMHSN